MAPLPIEFIHKWLWQNLVSGTNPNITLPVPPSGYWQINYIRGIWYSTASGGTVVTLSVTDLGNFTDFVAIAPWSQIGTIEYTGPLYDPSTESLVIQLTGLSPPGDAELEVRYTLLGASF